MRKSKQYNNLSEKFLAKVPKLAVGETATFILDGIRPDPINKGRFLIPTKNVKPTDTVIDPTSKQLVDIAAVRSVKANGEAVLMEIWFDAEAGGRFTLNGRNADDQMLYTYLMLCNYRSNNPDRDPSVEALFHLEDVKQMAKANLAKKDKERQAENLVFEMSDEDVKTTASSLGWAETKDIDVLRDSLSDYARSNADEFLKLSVSEQRDMKANVKRALDKGILKFDKTSFAYKWGTTGDVIATVPRTTGMQHLDGFVGFVNTSKNGRQIYDQIVDLLK
jgi:ribosomal protein S18